MDTSRTYWTAHLEAIRTEDITTAAYARREGLEPQVLYRWRNRLKEEDADTQRTISAPATRQFIPVRLRDSDETVRCTLVIAPGVRLELAQLPAPEWLARLGAAVGEQVR